MRRALSLLLAALVVVPVVGCSAKPLQASGAQPRTSTERLAKDAALPETDDVAVVRSAEGGKVGSKVGQKRTVLSGSYLIEAACQGDPGEEITFWLVVDGVVDSWATVPCGTKETYPALLHADGQTHEITMRVGREVAKSGEPPTWYYARLLRKP